MIIPDLDSQILSQTTSVIKIVQLTCGSCMHTNKVKVSNVQRLLLINKFPQVKTSMEQVSGSSIKHLTQICYMHRRYTIEDTYEFALVQGTQTEARRQPGTFISQSQNSRNSGQEQNSDSSKNSKQSKKQKTKKICFFHKGEKQNHRHIKRNTKNIPKNFCKAFANYMSDRPNKLTDEWSVAMKNLKKIEKKQKYNNITMKKILQNQTIVPFFKDFLINHAEEWIKTSKISDKMVHLQAINIYLQLLGKLPYAEVDPSPTPSDQ